MRLFLFSFAGIPILIADCILLYVFPGQVSALSSREEGWILLGGSVFYFLLHFFLRKPERMYLWAHEFAHLVVAKIFFRKVHSFQITSRDGGKVVIDRTNVMIDLAPYVFPLYSLAAAFAAGLFRTASPWVPDAYLAVASFLFTMHLVFSVEGFFRGQPDVKRSGRLFSAAVVLLCLLLWIPCLLAPGTNAGWKGALAAYRGLFGAGWDTGRGLFLYGMARF
ncbi:MAG: hypothetical protein M0Z38_03275 [Deltaproteobacteria bacterium]|nr:hypothetical protein [Deltaproteobacteria bacterium]